MDKVKQWAALSAVLAVAVLAAGWFLLVAPQRAEADDLQSQTDVASSASDALRIKIEQLQAQAAELPREQAKLEAVAAAIPSDPGLPDLIRALTAAAADAGLELVSVTPGEPTPVETSAAGVAAPADPAATSAESATAAMPAAAGTGALSSISLSLNVVGTYAEVEQFMLNVESLPRALRVTELSITPGVSPTAGETQDAKDGSSLSVEVKSLVFLADRPTETEVDMPAGSVTTEPGAAPGSPTATALPAKESDR